MARSDNGAVIIALDPGCVTGWAIYQGEVLLRFGQFGVSRNADIDGKLGAAIEGRSGRPKYGTLVHPFLGIVEEGSDYYHVSHKGDVGERAIKNSMRVNSETRFRLERSLLRCGVPHLGVKGETWGSAESTVTDALAELARAGITEPPEFRINNRRHQRDAIVMGGRMVRRKLWELK